MSDINIRGARTHNLKNIDVKITRNKLNILVGVSGSGKSTIAYDVIVAEGQRQFLESVSTYAARVLTRTEKPDVDAIENLSPTISIDQKRLRNNPRSTVGTATEIYSYLRLLFSRFGSAKDLNAEYFSFNSPKGACKKCKGLGVEYSVDPETVFDFKKSLSGGASKIGICKPGSRYLNIIKLSGKVDIDKPIKDYTKKELDFLLYSPRLVLSNKERGFIQTFSHEGVINRLVRRASDLRGISISKEKNEEKYWNKKACGLCGGGRINKTALSSKINGKNIGELSGMQLTDFLAFMKKLKISNAESLVARIIENTEHLELVNLGYLNLNRGIDTLSGGESQRLKLARELGTDLIEMVYVLDEPTAGLHPKDVQNLIELLKQLRDSKNTVIVVEHDESVIKSADRVIEIGPGAGRKGGSIVFAGTVGELIKDKKSITGKYLANGIVSEIKVKTREPIDFLELRRANTNNLKNVNVKIPLGVFCCVTGVSGSGKSSLVIDELAKKFNDRVVLIDQNPITGSARGNAATYVGAFDPIRKLFANENGVSASLFSANSKGACPDCGGLGFKKIDMHFMGDVVVGCATCQGKRYKKEVLEYEYKGKNISDVLDMTINEASKLFDQKNILNRLKMLVDVGLGYITLGQTHDTFSGGEAQRLKLASELHKSGEIFILDEPTSGLHFADIKKLLVLLNQIVNNGNSAIVIEHNLDVIRQADWIIDMGPGGGDEGGKIIAEGEPKELCKNARSITGKYLRK
ncbi:ATP-binding cassette domain-containing protein [Patescibacteria group bacterium]